MYDVIPSKPLHAGVNEPQGVTKTLSVHRLAHTANSRSCTGWHMNNELELAAPEIPKFAMGGSREQCLTL